MTIHQKLKNASVAPTSDSLSLLSLSHLDGNVTGDREIQQDPSHCKNPSDAQAVAEEGGSLLFIQPGRRRVCPARCPGGTPWRSASGPTVRGRGARDVPEPPHLQAAVGSGRGRVRVHQLRPLGPTLRRVCLRRDPPSRLPIRIWWLGPVPRSRGFSEMLPRGSKE